MQRSCSSWQNWRAWLAAQPGCSQHWYSKQAMAFRMTTGSGRSRPAWCRLDWGEPFKEPGLRWRAPAYLIRFGTSRVQGELPLMGSRPAQTRLPQRGAGGFVTGRLAAQPQARTLVLPLARDSGETARSELTARVR